MQLRKEAWKKIQDFNGVWTRDLAIPVRCSTNWAMKPLTLGAGQLWVHMFPWKKWVLMIYEINHIWTAEMKWKWRNDRIASVSRGHMFKPRWSPEFFSGFFTQLHKLHSLRRSCLHFHFISAVHRWFISYIINKRMLIRSWIPREVHNVENWTQHLKFTFLVLFFVFCFYFYLKSGTNRLSLGY